MTSDDFIYGILLIISLLCGHLVKNAGTRSKKQWITSSIGVVMVLMVCKGHIIHSFVTAFINCLIVKFTSPRKCHLASFVWCFGYLVFFRTTHYLGLPKVPSHSNAVQLLLTLKMVGMAFEVHDSYKAAKKSKENPEDDDAKLQIKYKNIKPSIMDMMHYSYCFVGLLTGPYFKFRTYSDMLEQKNSENIPSTSFLIDKIKMTVILAVCFVISSYFYNIEYAKTDEFFTRPFWYRLLYMSIMFFVFRTRIYTAWIMSECICITAGLGAYPKSSKPKCGHGPTDLKALDQSETEEVTKIEYDFETIHNINVGGCEFTSTVREGMKAWNMSVQFWLANYIYRRVPVRSIRTSVTMTVSAFWHGVHPGYYLSFLTIPPCLMAESAMAAAFYKNSSPTGRKIYEWVAWFFKMRAFDYMCMGFLLLEFWSTINYWASIYFIIHILVVLCVVIGNMFTEKQKPEVKQE